jgi:hypothetical protein
MRCKSYDWQAHAWKPFKSLLHARRRFTPSHLLLIYPVICHDTCRTVKLRVPSAVASLTLICSEMTWGI